MESPAERWESMYREDEFAQEALLQNPMEMGQAYDPSGPLAPGLRWDDVAQWSSAVQGAVSRRLEDVVVAVIGRDTTPMINAVPHANVVQVEDASEDGLLGLLTHPHQRFVLIV